MGKKTIKMPGSKNAKVGEQAKKMMMVTPVTGILGAIEMYINVLRERGIEISDWDDKDRKLHQIRMIGDKAYFLAAPKEENKEGDCE